MNNHTPSNHASSDSSTSALPSAQRIGGFTCEEFQDQLPELVTAGGSTFSQHPHLVDCANCAALVRDLRAIADAARDLLPAHDPSPDLWNQIQDSLQREAVEPLLDEASDERSGI